MPNLTQITVTKGKPTAGDGTVSTLDALMADGGQATVGAKADAAQPDPAQSASLVALVKGWLTTLGQKTDAKSTATDGTSITVMSVLKQISASIQAALTVRVDQLANAGSSFTAAQVSVDTTAGGTLIAAADLARKFLEIRNTGSAIVYWGPTGVTTATGYPLGPGESFTLDAPMNTAAIYGIVASGSVTVATMKW